jgi:predicted metal-dependent phosphoesterase TrpH
VRIDLHTHSTASDGTQSPTELVHAAAAAGLDVLALTDHDTAAGWAEAEAAALVTGIRLVRGVEISTRHAGHGVHLLAYLVDPTYPPLVEALAMILAGRSARLPAILEGLRSVGIAIDVRDVQRVSGATSATGRPHVADALVDLGVVSDRAEAFTRYLNPGRPAYAQRYVAPLTEVVALVVAAGGVPVLAHPWGRHDAEALQEDGLAALQAAGLAGLEVDHQEHAPATRAALRSIAGNLGLLVTGSSDHHGGGKTDHDLGCNTTAGDQLEALLALASTTGRAAGRMTPGVVDP